MAVLWLALTLTLGSDAPGGQATVSAPAAQGVASTTPFSVDSISLVIRAQQPLVQSCYGKMMATRNERREGRVVTSFVITPAGTVTDSRVEKTGTTLTDAGLSACLLAVLDGLSSPKPPRTFQRNTHSFSELRSLSRSTPFRRW